MVNIIGRALALSEAETEEQALNRVKESKYLTHFIPQEYAPFYDTEYKFGKLILRVNAAHPALIRISDGHAYEIYRDGPFLGLSAKSIRSEARETLSPTCWSAITPPRRIGRR